jgi:hypothetical protein
MGTADKIVSPSNNSIPISGVWEIYKYVHGDTGESPGQDVEKWIGKTAIFRGDTAVLGDESCSSPLYKIRIINSADYLLYQYKIKSDYLGIQSSSAEVVTVTSQNQFFYEFIKSGESEIITNIDGTFFYLRKISDNTDKAYNEYLNTNRAAASGENQESSTLLRSGILLGLKSYRAPDSSSQKLWTYRTIWIPSQDRKIGNIYETGNLFVPRKSGFWNIGVIHMTSGNVTQDKLYAFPTDRGLLSTESRIDAKSDTPEIIPSIDSSIILYAGNDYISTECSKNSRSPNKDVYQVLSIDNLNSTRAVKISDIAGEAGIQALKQGAAEYLSSEPALKNRLPAGEILEDNFTITRRNGHWIMRGRLNFEDGLSPSFMDFNVKVIPPSKLVSYDELCLSWSSIKARIPEAIDAYTSPNRDMAVIVTSNSLLVYSIENGVLSGSPQRKIKLNEKETVVMAEWSSGKYTDKWDKEFIKNGASQIKD